MPLNTILSIPISPILKPIFLSQPIFAQRFAKVSRVEDPYVRIFDICEDIQSGSRAAVKDYSACTSQQMGDVLMSSYPSNKICRATEGWRTFRASAISSPFALTSPREKL